MFGDRAEPIAWAQLLGNEFGDYLHGGNPWSEPDAFPDAIADAEPFPDAIADSISEPDAFPDADPQPDAHSGSPHGCDRQ